MANCVYYSFNHRALRCFCASKKHPNYDKEYKAANLGAGVPSQCIHGGEGCPIFMKEINSTKKKRR